MSNEQRQFLLSSSTRIGLTAGTIGALAFSVFSLGQLKENRDHRLIVLEAQLEEMKQRRFEHQQLLQQIRDQVHDLRMRMDRLEKAVR